MALHTALEAPVAAKSLSIVEPPLFAAGDGLRPVLTRYRDLLAQQWFAQAAHLFASQVAQVPAELLGSPPDPCVEVAAETVAAAVGGLRDLEALTDDGLDLDRWGGLTMPVLLLRGELTWEPMPRTMIALASRLPSGSEQSAWTSSGCQLRCRRTVGRPGRRPRHRPMTENHPGKAAVEFVGDHVENGWAAPSW